MTEGDIALIVVGVIAAIVVLAGIRVIRPTHVGAIETLGRFSGFRRYGITYVFPAIQKLYKVNVTEQLVDVTKQDVITKDNLNCTVDAQVYFRVGKSDDDAQADLLKRVREEDLKAALYNVNNYYRQVVELARTTLRNEIGRTDFKQVQQGRPEQGHTQKHDRGDQELGYRNSPGRTKRGSAAGGRPRCHEHGNQG